MKNLVGKKVHIAPESCASQDYGRWFGHSGVVERRSAKNKGYWVRVDTGTKTEPVIFVREVDLDYLFVPEDEVDYSVNVTIEERDSGWFWLTMDSKYEMGPFRSQQDADENATKTGFRYREPKETFRTVNESLN